MKLVSVLTIAIKQDKKFLVVGRQTTGTGGVWGFLSAEFEENLNGNLDDTLKRMLGKTFSHWQSVSGIEYLGSYIQETGGKILIGYDFLIENFEGELNLENFRWLEQDSFVSGAADNPELDKNTKNFLKLNGDVL